MPVLTDHKDTDLLIERQEYLLKSRLSRAELDRFRKIIHLKALSILLVFAAGYLTLILGPGSFLSITVGSFLLVNGVLAAATGIMHDANHSAFSGKRGVNSAAACVADLLGASSWLWRFQHNLAHHRHTNVVGLDEDIEQMPFLRLTTTQPSRFYMRYQHVYAWFLYSFLTIKWLFVGDFLKISKPTTHAAGSSFPVTPLHRASVVLGKLSHVSWAIIVPLFFHGWVSVAIVYALCAAAVGVVLSTIFQLAHCVDRAEVLDVGHGLNGNLSFEHQVRTTVNIKWRNGFSSAWAWWLFGGLDRQIEHHIAPRSPHTSYKRLSILVKEECERRGLEYMEHDGLMVALKSHYRHLKNLAV